jgi:uncharacterized SAM-binding protein YcdF (DUF218 family)
MIDHRELTPVKLLYTVKNRKEFILAGFMFFSILQRFYRWIAIDQVVLWFILIAFALLWLRLEKWGRRMLTAAVIFLVVIVVIPLGSFGVAYLENYFPSLVEIPKDTKGIILLGGSFDLDTSAARGVTCYNQRGGRIIQFMELAQKYPHLPLVFTGGGMRFHPSAPSESELARRLFENLQLDLSRIRFEDQSNSTFENAKFTFDMIQPKAGEHWVLVTSALHMPRAVTLFRSMGWNVVPYPVDYITTGKQNYGPNFSLYEGFKFWQQSTHEWLGLIHTYFTGTSQSLLPDK